MTYPPLPEPTIINGRSLYTAGDMRAYGVKCHDAGRESLTIAGRTKQQRVEDDLTTVEELFGKFGMKK